jgi:NADH-quinone oxidoreductase subunit N
MEMAVSFNLEDFVCVLPALCLFLASLIPLTIKVIRGNKEPNPTSTVVYAFVGLVASLFCSLVLYSGQTSTYFAFGRSLIFDGISVYATSLVVLLTAIAILFSRESLSTRGPQFSEYVFLVLNAAVGMMILSWSNDLIVTFIGIEVMSLCLYLLIALSEEERLSKEAAFKYFVLGSMASAVFLYGIALIFGLAGTSQIDKILAVSPQLIGSNYLYLIGVLFAVLGFCFKVSVAPFHAWTPDVYEGAPTPLTGFMATAVKLVTFVAFVRFLSGDYLTSEITGHFVTVLQWLAVLTMLVGNIGALMQSGLKRMLAYSSIAHSGYIMMGVVAGAVGGDSWIGSSGVIYYVFAYSLMTLGAFGVLSILERTESDLLSFDDVSGLAKRSPFLAACFSLFLLSLAGIPPTVGFFGKFFLFSAAVKQGFFWMVVWAAINSIISVYYYLRPIVKMYMEDGGTAAVSTQTRSSLFAVGVLATLVILVGLATEPVYRFVTAAALNLP